MVGDKQADAEQRERELQLKQLMREVRQLRLQAEREASERASQTNLSNPDYGYRVDG